ncbi:MAG: Stp1/IreP family PP2C-type Ser/Thr phosphatase [Lachnospiraceae bacterium]|nr:Stp1/IreP family PP2C-type Ser/Thr phosphatase [Lachnospiraceae bacterium]
MLKSFSRTDIGKKRKLNQDYIFSSDEKIGNLSNVFIVADGMGGHAAGDLASKSAVEVIIRSIGESFESNPSIILRKAIEAANERVFEVAEANPELAGMGPTVVAAPFIGRFLQVANVGDSRLYVIHDREIRQVTVDHSLVEEMVRRGAVTREDSSHHPKKNIITRAVGVKETVDVDLFTEELEDGDMVLLCTDGLTNMVSDERIRMTVAASRDVTEAVIHLVDEANEQGGKDNISVILVQYEEEKTV